VLHAVNGASSLRSLQLDRSASRVLPKYAPRMRRATFVAMTVLAIGLMWSASSEAATQSKKKYSLRIALVTRTTDINNFVDTGPEGPSPGDLYVFEDQIFKTSKSTTAIGTAPGTCVLIDPAALRYQCEITSKLPDGDVSSSGILELRVGTVSTGAITGGTGRFRDARGQATLELGPLEGPHKVTYLLNLHP
jgi:hypothetical protein